MAEMAEMVGYGCKVGPVISGLQLPGRRLGWLAYGCKGWAVISG